MKRLLSSLLILLLLGCSICFATVNKMLERADCLYREATTLADFKAAKVAYENARNDIAYDNEHEDAIREGIINCNRKIRELSPRLLVNGSSHGSDMNIGADGGDITFEINTNLDGQVDVKGLPAWLSMIYRSNSEIVLNCAPNDVTLARQAYITFRAGNLRVRYMVRQDAASEFIEAQVETESDDEDRSGIANETYSKPSVESQIETPEVVTSKSPPIDIVESRVDNESIGVDNDEHFDTADDSGSKSNFDSLNHQINTYNENPRKWLYILLIIVGFAAIGTGLYLLYKQWRGRQ